MFILLGTSLFLTALLGFTSLAAVFTAMLWRSAARVVWFYRPIVQARIFFWLRLLPLLVGAAIVLILVAPAYLVLEPRATNETVSLKLG